MNRERYLTHKLNEEKRLVEYWKERCRIAEALTQEFLNERDATEEAAPAMEKAKRRFKLRKRR